MVAELVIGSSISFKTMANTNNTTIGFIGLGQMARAMARAWAAQFPDTTGFTGFDPAKDARNITRSQIPGLCIADDNEAVVRGSDTVVLAVKPQVMSQVCEQIATEVQISQPLIISIAAGIRLEQLCRWLGTDRVVRVMPNTPCLVGVGASAFASAGTASVQDRQQVEQLFQAIGVCHELEEGLLDAVTGLSGSGPAFVFVVLEALIEGGMQMGLPQAVAQSLAAQTVLGAASLLQHEQVDPLVLKNRVASPGGTTVAGLTELENGEVRAAMIAAVSAATNRSVELGQS